MIARRGNWAGTSAVLIATLITYLAVIRKTAEIARCRALARSLYNRLPIKVDGRWPLADLRSDERDLLYDITRSK